ncbi:Receptor-type tyrosine-protein phosphatase T [Aphelenchoides fujianensis]|nr:Receptor-type tyrosine-protein phosphatase T [Aphelenchoides fujianensis]
MSTPAEAPRKRTPKSLGKGETPGVKRKPKTPTRRGGTTRDEDEAAGHPLHTVATVEEGDEKQPADGKGRKAAETAMINFGMSVAQKSECTPSFHSPPVAEIEGLKAEFKEIQSFQPPDTAATAGAQHKEKNRYSNIPCYDRTRVVLKFGVPPETDYIHANFIFESLFLEVSSGGEQLQVVLHRWLDWPGVWPPLRPSGMGMLRILKHIRDVKDSTAVVHCSAGVGRTGTIMACEICLRILLEGKELNVRVPSPSAHYSLQVPEVVKEMRTQRAGSIQTEGQYIYLHRTLCEYVHAKKLIKDVIVEFFQAYNEYSKLSNKPSSAAEPPAAAPVPR